MTRKAGSQNDSRKPRGCFNCVLSLPHCNTSTTLIQCGMRQTQRQTATYLTTSNWDSGGGRNVGNKGTRGSVLETAGWSLCSVIQVKCHVFLCDMPLLLEVMVPPGVAACCLNGVHPATETGSAKVSQIGSGGPYRARPHQTATCARYALTSSAQAQIHKYAKSIRHRLTKRPGGP